MKRELDGVLAVSLEQAVAAPYCSRLLSDSGARVIKVERPEGDFARYYDSIVHQNSAYFCWLNAGKESISIDLTNPDDLSLLRTMIQTADVFIQNLKPGVAEKYSLDHSSNQHTNPGLITCNISGYGGSGEYASMKAYDALIQAETGLCSVTGPADTPSKVGASICDISTGLTAYSEILKCLYKRETSKKGAEINVSLFGVLSEWMSVPLAYYEYGNKVPKGTGLDHGQLAPYGQFETKTGPVFLVIQSDREWQRFCVNVLGVSSIADDKRFNTNQKRMENLISLKQVINDILRTLPLKEVIKKLDNSQIAYGRVNTVKELSEHPALERREIETNNGKFITVDHVGNSKKTNIKIPELDEHGSLIRKEFGSKMNKGDE